MERQTWATGRQRIVVVVVAIGASAVAAARSLGAETPASIAAPSQQSGATLARIIRSTRVTATPGQRAGISGVSPTTNFSHQPQTLLVLATTQSQGREWLRVLLPIRPNGTSGWIPRDNAVLSQTPYWVTVDKRAHLVLIYRVGMVLRRYRAVLGKAATPTPDGLAAIYEKNQQPNPHAFLGPWALPLTILSNQLASFGGGPGRIAIHGRGSISLRDPLGSSRSHGCVRIDNAPIAWIAQNLQPGTPVNIVN